MILVFQIIDTQYNASLFVKVYCLISIQSLSTIEQFELVDDPAEPNWCVSDPTMS
jgi:hypothetical protein